MRNHIKLEPLDRRRSALKVEKIYNFDATFYDWLHRIPKQGQAEPSWLG